YFFVFFFFQAEDGIRDFHVTGVQTCALPISRFDVSDRARTPHHPVRPPGGRQRDRGELVTGARRSVAHAVGGAGFLEGFESVGNPRSRTIFPRRDPPSGSRAARSNGRSNSGPWETTSATPTEATSTSAAYDLRLA